MREAARTAAEASFERISLNVEPTNPARALYQEEGFTTVKSRPDDQSMVKFLSVRPRGEGLGKP
ncbi:hypothetical protein SNA_11305 [Streptomyces natalensis ATCC 27448]|uniref:N-acetyltransferase domain-containing protein n=1 Tax=Streptomyces natalensis ATCC 27448 TaxID=1240678 RepID=A0A0D7CP72_9ACTN|nr:hypothetical protein SNA_11305 [Streptomyces natalensis ATCC 27448]